MMTPRPRVAMCRAAVVAVMKWVRAPSSIGCI
jgi:hypothetical protein